MARTAFPSNPVMTAICIAYMNEMYVADQVCPYTAAVNKESFTYDEYPIGEQLTPEYDLASRSGLISEINYSSIQKTATIGDHALASYVPYGDIASSSSPARVLNNAAMQTMNKIMMNREIRVANLVFKVASYDATGVTAVAAGDKFSTADADALGVINTRLDGMLMRANTMVLSQKAWLALRSNASIVQSVHKSGNNKGMATIEEVQNLFEIGKIIVARANRNVNNAPKSLNAGKIWGNHIALMHQEPASQAQGSYTFCGTVPFETAKGITAGDDFDPKRGVRGSHEVRVAQQVKELIFAKGAGALITGVA